MSSSMSILRLNYSHSGVPISHHENLGYSLEQTLPGCYRQVRGVQSVTTDAFSKVEHETM